ncbi:MAG: phosphate regulon sensor histidine kinase PhoR [Gammaproteobacteria bacterium]|nr:phosphate regulon sensor histidine kinase PhoR [Gammaproteobacteria bacterium]
MRVRGRKRKRKLSPLLSGIHKSTKVLPDATVVLNSKGEMEWGNIVARGMLGLERKRDRGRMIDELITNQAFQNYYSAGDFSHPLNITSPVNDDIRLEIRIVPYGKVKYLLQARDITRLRQLETVRRDFVANVSHEMRTPLTVIHGYLETMGESEGEDLAPWQNIITQMRQQTGRLQRIVEDLLLLSRLESPGQEDGLQAPVDVPMLLEFVRDEALSLSKGEHSITTDIDETIKLQGSASELESIFSNLVFNAVRYTPAGGRIRLRWWSSKRGPCFLVKDTGIGIEAEHIPRLAERFYRVDVGRSRKSGGTGLGLAIVKHALTRHGSQLKIESEPGKGSSFRCCFPPSRLSK